jgi:hypothetical protein
MSDKAALLRDRSIGEAEYRWFKRASVGLSKGAISRCESRELQGAQPADPHRGTAAADADRRHQARACRIR